MTAPTPATRGLTRKVRKHADYIHVTRELDRLQIRWELCCASGLGHPFLLVGGKLRYPVGSTPGGYTRSDQIVSSLRKVLRGAGMLEKEQG
jgi:hypothetical protein